MARSSTRVLQGVPPTEAQIDRWGLARDELEGLPAGRWGLENVANLEKLSPSQAILVVGLPKIKDATGGPVRLIALV